VFGPWGRAYGLGASTDLETVLTETPTLAMPFGASVTDVVESEQLGSPPGGIVMPCGGPTGQLSITVPENPAVPPRVTVCVAICPAATDCCEKVVGLFWGKLKSVAVPDTLTS
jgi:hypothetical protein